MKRAKIGVVNSGRRFGDIDAILDLLGRIEPGLFIDAGAAAGLVTRAMLERSPASRVVAFEPFPGNFPHFARTVGDDPRVTLRPVALADRGGEETLHVRAVVQGSEPGWEAMTGYSSLGFLAPANSSHGAATHNVAVARLDDEIDRPVRFLKIDIQGGEYRLLTGAEKLIRDHGIDLMYIEFSGDHRVLHFLARHGYIIFDSVYEAWPHRRYWRNFLSTRDKGRIPGWERVGTGRMSTGKSLNYVWPRIALRGFRSYCAWLRFTNKFACHIQTNLICVHRDFLAQVI